MQRAIRAVAWAFDQDLAQRRRFAVWLAVQAEWVRRRGGGE
jgi:hypothetical protein